MSTTEPGTIRWIKSTYSTNNGACVELAFSPNAIATRDSKNPTVGSLTIPRTAFSGFITHAGSHRHPPT